MPRPRTCVAGGRGAPSLNNEFRGFEMSKKLGGFIFGGFVLIASVLLLGRDTTYGWEYLPRAGILRFPRLEAVSHISREKLEGVGKIISTEHEETGLVSTRESVYINLGEGSGVEEGKEYRIFRNVLIREPKIGYLITRVGRLKIVKVEKNYSKALIVKAFVAVNIGDSLVPFDREDPQLFTEIKLKRSASQLNGHVVMVDENKEFFGKGDIVYFDLGSQDGIEAGNCFVFYRKVGEGMGGLFEEKEMVRYREGEQGLPDAIIRLGEMIVLTAQPSTSSSLVIKSNVPMYRGEKFTTGPCGWEMMAKVEKVKEEVKEEIQKEKLVEEEVVEKEVIISALPKEEAPSEEGERIREIEAKAFPDTDVLFDFDRYNLRAEAREILKEKADWLTIYPDTKVLIEGHCDERGTNAYNLALGERRAAAVKRYLIQLGIEEQRLSTISYGEEMPFDPGHNEAAWKKNRRVHFVKEEE